MSREKPTFIVFLDFNGVVMRKRSRRFDKNCVQRINFLVNKLNAHIVVSSSKRLLLNLNKLNTFFNGKIIGETPDLDYPYYGNVYIRYKEVLEYLERNGLEKITWLALDDRADHFPKSAPVFLINSERLITDENVNEVLAYFNKNSIIEEKDLTTHDSVPQLIKNHRIAMCMIIFLDFDGVLRRLSSEPSRFDPDCLEHLESVICQFPEIKIVISSTWRLAMSLKELRGLFSQDLGKKIVGKTPEVPFDIKHSRYKEIQAYLINKELESEHWIAIDDDPEHYPRNAPVLLTDANEGFNKDSARTLQKLIRGER